MKNKFRLIKIVIKQHATCDHDYCPNTLEQWFYVMKTVVAILFDRVSDEDYYGFDYHITMAIYDVHDTYGEYTGAEWTQLNTAEGFWDWRYSEVTDGYP